MLSEDKFFEKAQKFHLFPTTDGAYLTLEELKEQTKDAQTDKDDKLIQLYAANVDEQHAYIEAAKSKRLYGTVARLTHRRTSIAKTRARR